jgi:hypothetical protein
VFVAAPSVPVRQASTEFAFPPDKTSLKQALESITALQLSESTSQGPAASTEETNTAKRQSETRILKVSSEFNFGDYFTSAWDEHNFGGRQLLRQLTHRRNDCLQGFI